MSIEIVSGNQAQGAGVGGAQCIVLELDDLLRLQAAEVGIARKQPGKPRRHFLCKTAGACGTRRWLALLDVESCFLDRHQ